MSYDLASTILDTIRDALDLQVGIMRSTDELGGQRYVVTACDSDGQRWVSRHEDFYGAVCGLAGLVGLNSKMAESLFRHDPTCLGQPERF